MNSFVEKIADCVSCRHLFAVGDRVVVALSGGADSVALLSALTRLGYDCVAAHCNFHLRGDESDRDEAFARSMAERLGAKFVVEHFEAKEYASANKISIEMACRELRYEWFGRVCAEVGSKVVAVAHHADDNVETFLLNLFRGTGIAGLKGMRYSRPLVDGGDINVVRPMLDVSRSDVETYLSAEGLDYVTDSTNLENDFMRNRIRNVVLPTIEKEFPDAKQGIATTIANLADDYALNVSALSRYINECFDEKTGRLRLLLINDLSIAKAVTAAVASRYGFSRQQALDMTQTHQPGCRFESKKAIAVVDRAGIVFTMRDAMPNALEMVELRLPGETYLPDGVVVEAKFVTRDEVEFTRDGSTVYFDGDVLNEVSPLKMRRWQEGDRFRPFGMIGSRLLSDVFSDLKLNEMEKRSVWLLTDCVERILWIAGIRASNHFIITPTTSRIVRIRIVK
ncbi:MAG: tRNA lysidine(34) synthetase TilS [Muribaculaceae bacterium]|nr:tRNA lysidine(34) synthetase TilS [Muribaculaceae bacterium]